jgi:glycosyltransferase involved in cell wall biosynthesis
VNLRLPGLDAARQSVVPNAVYEATTDGDAAAPRGDLISIGGFEPRKNQQFLLRVLAACRARGARYTLTLVGDGPQRASLRQLAGDLGIADQIVFTGARSNAAPLIGGHRAFVHAARMESLGIVLIEALAAGKPVFAAPVGGIPELFTDGVEGCSWSLDAPEEAAARLISVLEDPRQLAAMSQAARVRYQTLFTPEATQPRLLASIRGDLRPALA